MSIGDSLKHAADDLKGKAKETLDKAKGDHDRPGEGAAGNPAENPTQPVGENADPAQQDTALGEQTAGDGQSEGQAEGQAEGQGQQGQGLRDKAEELAGKAQDKLNR